MSTSRTTALTIWMIASIFYAYQYIIKVMPNIMFDDIMGQFNFDAATFGQFSGVYYIGYSLLHLPVGILLDRFGPRKVMTACILMTVVGVTPILFAETWVYPIIGRLITGIGSSAAILGAFKVIRMSFKEAHFTRMLSFTVTIGLLGAIYGGAPVSYLVEGMGYQTVVQIFCVGGLALAALTYIAVPEMQPTAYTSVFADIRQVLSNKKVIWLSILSGLMVGPIEGFADVWATMFLKSTYGYDAVTAASLPSMVFVGMCFGGPILSIIAEKTGSYLGVITTTGVIMAAFFIGMLGWDISVTAVSVGLFVVGICCAYQILSVYKASTYVSENVAGLTNAFANMVIMVFGYGFHSVIGLVIQLTEPLGPDKAFLYGIWVIPVALIISIIGLSTMMLRGKN